MLANRIAIYEQYKDDKDALKQQTNSLPASYKNHYQTYYEQGNLTS